jgi:hypothetical protein
MYAWAGPIIRVRGELLRSSVFTLGGRQSRRCGMIVVEPVPVHDTAVLTRGNFPPRK